MLIIKPLVLYNAIARLPSHASAEKLRKSYDATLRFGGTLLRYRSGVFSFLCEFQRFGVNLLMFLNKKGSAHAPKLIDNNCRLLYAII